MQQLEQATLEQLSDVAEIGQTIAESVHGYLHRGCDRGIISRLREVGVSMASNEPKPTKGGALAGKTLVVTGTLRRHTRLEMQALIESYGGRAAASVSKNTSYLIAGEKAGSKLAKAEKLGVEVLSEEDFEKMFME